MELKWKLLTPLTTVKVGRALWMTLIPHQYMTPKGVETIPAGYLFDHASVPNMFTNIVPPVKSCLGEASLPHDRGYDNDTPDDIRDFVDEGLKEITLETAKMADKHTDKIIAKLAYYAVHFFAKSLFNKQFNTEKIKDAYRPFKEMGIEKLREKFVLSWEVLPNFNFDSLSE